ncbi:MAG: MFS transporter [Rhizobiaceae bacterium]|nr:MFS transporter [Rhizobiaceae bacterium]MCV0405245.1 MFS transporter [Rhizobiaceae bacterium]
MQTGQVLTHVDASVDTGRARRAALVLLTALSALNHLDRQLIAIVLEPIRAEFALSDIQLGLLSGLAFAALYTTLGIPASLWVVRHSRVGLVSLSAIVWGMMTALTGAAQSFAHLLLARVGVGIGEAGFLPASHAIVSALYQTGKRATALAVVSAGVNVGIFLAFLVGGVVAQFYGWRTAFFLSGAVTVTTALLFRFMVAEPEGDRAEPGSVAAGAMSTLSDTARRIFTDPVLRHVTLGALLSSMVAYGALTWLPSFLLRSHGFSLTGAGTYLALVIGIGGGLGTWAGGYYSDRLGARDIRWSLWLIALVLLATKPFTVGFFLVEASWLALILFLLPAMTSAIFVGPSISTLHERVPPMVRPVASAIFLFLTSFIGIGLSPIVVGALSQWVFASAGEESLRYALVVLQLLGVLGAVHFWLAGRALKAG